MRILVALCCLLMLSGCLQNHALIKLKADGSGTVEITDLFKKQLLEGLDANAKNQMFSEEKAKGKAANMGGEFVKVEALTEGDYVGQKAFYSFKDVTKLNIDALGADKPDPGAKNDPPKITFGKSDDDHPLLKIVFPKGKEKPAKPAEKKDPAQEAQELEMMKKMLAGMRISLAIEVEGSVEETSSPHVDGKKVTIFDIAFDGLLAKPELMKKMDESPDDPETMAKIFKDVEGVKVIDKNEFSLEFK